MASIFTKIIQGEIPCTEIDHTEKELAFLDISPCWPGHTLVIPKREVIRFEDLTEAEVASLAVFLNRVAKAVSKAFDGIDYNITLNNGENAGQEVPYVHFHIIPRPEGKKVGFKTRYKYEGNEKEEVAQKIRNCIS